MSMSSGPPSPSLCGSIIQDSSGIHGSLEFRIGLRKVTATTAERLDIRQTVYRLKIRNPSILDDIPILSVRLLFVRVLEFCPYIKTLFPGWFLPSTVILKKRKPEWDDEFKVEKFMYRLLKPLQGKFIPYFYGEAIYDDSPALIFSEIIGQTLLDVSVGPNNSESDEQLKRNLLEVYEALARYKVVHGDCNLFNAIVTRDRVMLVDLEMARIDKDAQSIGERDALGLLLDFQDNRMFGEQARRMWEIRHF